MVEERLRAEVVGVALSREVQPMPDFVAEALERRGLGALYDMRPPFQRNDYLGWINRAKRPETKLRRLAQMLDELEAGDSYMNMPWRGRAGAADRRGEVEE